MVKHGFYNFLNWFDERAWYPLGRIVGGTVCVLFSLVCHLTNHCHFLQVYPGLMLTSGLIHYVLDSMNIPVHIRDICVFLAPVFSGLTAIATYLLTKELWNEQAGLFAACFIAIGILFFTIYLLQFLRFPFFSSRLHFAFSGWQL